MRKFKETSFIFGMFFFLQGCFNGQVQWTGIGLGMNNALGGGIQVSGFPSTGTAGTPFFAQPIVNILDNKGQINTQFVGSANFIAYSDAQCQNLVSGVFGGNGVPFVNGTATFTSLSFTTSGTLHFGLQTGGYIYCSPAVNISSGGAVKLAVSNLPSSGSVGMASVFSVTVEDNYGNPVSNSYADVSLSSSDEYAIFSLPSQVFSNATYNFSVTFMIPEIVSVTATSPSLTASSQNTTISANPQALLSASYIHGCRTFSGGAECWGDNASGELGNGTTGTMVAPTTVNASNISAIVSGEAHSCGIDSTGVVCWGSGALNQLGNGSVGSLSPSLVNTMASGAQVLGRGGNHTCAIVNGGAKCWGDNSSGQLGNGNMTAQTMPVQTIALSSGVQAIEGGLLHTCAIVSNIVKCWGSNTYGQLGMMSASLTPSAVQGLPSPSFPLAIAAGRFHSCALLAVGGQNQVWCWGNNSNGQLGISSSTAQSINPVQVTGLPTTGITAISAGDVHTCAIASGNVWCWGDNQFGELGNGTSGSTNLYTPVEVQGLQNSALAISAGAYFTCANTSSATQCWGLNSDNELGFNGANTDSASTPF